jgi:hypothetical protein
MSREFYSRNRYNLLTKQWPILQQANPVLNHDATRNSYASRFLRYSIEVIKIKRGRSYYHSLEKFISVEFTQYETHKN